MSRAILLVLLLAQALMSLRVRNSAFADEAQYIYAGQLELDHWLHGLALNEGFTSYFSGSPILYPVLAGAVSNVGGLLAARALSLLEMLSVTVLLFSMTRRLFNERAGLCAAAVFCCTEATLFIGNLATYDATCVFLLALASWIVVRTAQSRWPLYLLAGPVAALAVAVKYAGLLFVPTIAVLAVLAAMPYRGRWSVLRAPLFGLAVAAVIAGALRAAGPAYLAAIEQTTTNRPHGITPVSVLAHESLLWAGVPFALAVIGAVAYAWRPWSERDEKIAPPGGRLRRTMLGLLLTGTALLAPVYQAYLHTDVSYQKHVGFGLFFAAPMAGIGLVRIIGAHFRRVHLGIAVWAVALILGMVQAGDVANGWPDSAQLVSYIKAHAQPGAHYLVETDEVPIYYLLRDPDAQVTQFTSTFYINFINKKGKTLAGVPGYDAAIAAGYFRLVIYDDVETPGLDNVLAHDLATSRRYRLAALLPLRTSGGHPFYTHAGRPMYYYVWLRLPAGHPASPKGAQHGGRPAATVHPATAVPPATGHRALPGRAAG